MRIHNHCIYNLPFSYTRISEKQYEIEFKGILSYHLINIEQLRLVTKGQLELDSVNIFLFFQVQRNIDLILKDIEENEIVINRPVIINRLKIILRRELEEIGLELVDFKRISLWAYGTAAEANDRGVLV